MSLAIDAQPQADHYHIVAQGEVDLYTSPKLREAILKGLKTGANLGLDLSGVGYMDSSGVATLVEGMKASKAAGKDFVLISPADSVLKVLQLARLTSIFDIRDRYESAS